MWGGLGGWGHSAEHACSRAALTTHMFYWYLFKCCAINFNIDLQSQHNLYTVQICSPVSCWSLERSFPGSLFLVSVKMSKQFQSKWLLWVIRQFNNHDNGSAFLIKCIPAVKNVKKMSGTHILRNSTTNNGRGFQAHIYTEVEFQELWEKVKEDETKTPKNTHTNTLTTFGSTFHHFPFTFTCVTNWEVYLTQTTMIKCGPHLCNGWKDFTFYTFTVDQMTDLQAFLCSSKWVSLITLIVTSLWESN